MRTSQFSLICFILMKFWKELLTFPDWGYNPVRYFSKSRDDVSYKIYKIKYILLHALYHSHEENKGNVFIL